jgi:hypothetical protein
MKPYTRFSLLRIISSEIGRKCANDAGFRLLWNSWTHTKRSVIVAKLLNEGLSLREVLKDAD